ncbi:MAG TPA: biotin/lipoyl-containing protein [Candidatus Baltobacteraceae bacterium]|nr:biotin/lipoyl-containing protein [Candidatus Baltobacteraceae bacterium]
MAQRARPAVNGEAAELVALIDRLETVLAASNLSELEVEVGQTALVLRKPVALPAEPAVAAAGRESPAAERPPEADAGGSPYHQVLAPLTGLLYLSPSPDAAPYVQVGREVNQGQVIGLIEAMKLFNEIKSDVRGRVVRILAEHGALIKARQPILDVDPS